MKVGQVRAVPSGFFVLRTPLLPLDELRAWAESASTQDDERGPLRDRLRQIVERPDVREAIYLASPNLHDGIERWLAQPGGRRGQRVEQSLARYLARMCSRSTPFGLFAGYSIGALAGATSLRLAPRSEYRRRTRLDMEYLSGAAETISAAPSFRREACYRPNPTIYRAAGRLHYVERTGGPPACKVVAVVETPPLEVTLERAASGARQEDLVRTLAERGAPLERAREYVASLVEAGVLEARLDPPVTGPPALPSLIEALERQESTVAAAGLLGEAQLQIEALDREPHAVPPERYRCLASSLRQLGAPVEPGHLFQVDLKKPAPWLSLGSDLIAELHRGLERLLLLAVPSPDPLEQLRGHFRDRYGDQAVPLLEAFDEEAGLGLAALPSQVTSEVGADPVSVRWGARERLLLDKLAEAARLDAAEIVLEDAELRRLAPEPPAELPGAFAVMATLAGEPDRPDLVFLHGAFGPSGARMLARFCDGDDELARLVQRHLRDEEALDPDAIFAEVAHLPTARLGNVVRRPLLRDYEIDYLGPSGAPAERRIPLADLLVSLEQDRFVLHSQQLGRRVVPRVSSAAIRGLAVPPLFQLLTSLQSQGTAELSFDWGPFAHAATLPRLRVGSTVLAPARWRLLLDEVPDCRSLQELRSTRGLPRFIAVYESGTPLTIDLDNALAVEDLLAILRRQRSALALEIPGIDDGLCVTGPEGGFVNEVLVPFTRLPPEHPEHPGRPVQSARPKALTASVERRFPPGSEWLYAKLYGGWATLERVLCETLVPLSAEFAARGLADGWHFLRYGDPYPHLRLRLHGDADALQRQVLPELQAAVRAELQGGRIWRFAHDTYEREVERYGGPAAIGAVESLFAADSAAVAAILSEPGEADRLDTALLSAEALLRDLGLSLEQRRAAASALVGDIQAQLAPRTVPRSELAAEFRARRGQLEQARRELAAGCPVQIAETIQSRATAMAPHVGVLRRLAASGALSRPLAEIATSLAHLHVNRMLRDPRSEDELRIFDRIERLARSDAARAR